MAPLQTIMLAHSVDSYLILSYLIKRGFRLCVREITPYDSEVTDSKFLSTSHLLKRSTSAVSFTWTACSLR